MRIASLSCFLAFTATSAKAFAPSIGSRPLAAANAVVSHHHHPSTTNTIGGNSLIVRHMASKADFITSEITSNQVTIFSKSYCPYCSKTKASFAELGVEAKIYELNQMDDGADIQDALFEMTKQKTVPNVFVNGKHIGGNDDTQKAIASGEMKKLLGQ